MFNWLKRQRTSRGFGIHSPFAYDFVVNVLRERYMYYAYNLIKENDYRLIYRIALKFRPSQIYSRELPEYLNNELATCRNEDNSLQFYILSSEQDIFPEQRSEYVALLLNLNKNACINQRYKTLKDNMSDYGMVFCNPDRAVIVADKNLPRQNFHINF